MRPDQKGGPVPVVADGKVESGVDGATADSDEQLGTLYIFSCLNYIQNKTNGN